MIWEMVSESVLYTALLDGIQQILTFNVTKYLRNRATWAEGRAPVELLTLHKDIKERGVCVLTLMINLPCSATQSMTRKFKGCNPQLSNEELLTKMFFLSGKKNIYCATF